MWLWLYLPVLDLRQCRGELVAKGGKSSALCAASHVDSRSKSIELRYAT